MGHHFDIILRSIFLENLPLSFFLGMCTFLAISKQVKAAVGLGSAVLVLQIITVPLNNLIEMDSVVTFVANSIVSVEITVKAINFFNRILILL